MYTQNRKYCSKQIITQNNLKKYKKVLTVQKNNVKILLEQEKSLTTSTC